MSPVQGSKPAQIILFSQPRTACHLLERMLTSKQSGLQTCWHPFIAARFIQTQCLAEENVEKRVVPADLSKDFEKAIADGTKVWREALVEAQAKGEILFTHTHPHFALNPSLALEYVLSDWRHPAPSPASGRNYTLIPDDLLAVPGTVPIITFRHPASTAYTCYKAMVKFEGTATLSNLLVSRHIGWVRELFDWYVAQGIEPVLVEAEDYISERQVVRALAGRVGLDPEKCVFEWEPATEEDIKEMHPMYVKLQETLLRSKGVVEGKKRRIESIDAEYGKWRNEYGEDAANLIKEFAEVAMPDYEYLVEKKFSI